MFQRLFSGKARSLGLVIFLIVGLLLLGGGFYTLFKVNHLIKTGVRTVGVVVGYDYASDSDGDTYYPIIRFSTIEGEVVQFTESFGSSSQAFDVGETVNILYDPQNVKGARINKWFRLWFLPTMLIGFGLLDIVIGMNLVFAEIAQREQTLD